jgi:hypothetical protein
VPPHRRLGDACAEAHAQAQRLLGQERAEVRLVDGRVEEVRAPRIHMRARLRFEVEPSRLPLARTAPCSHLFDALQGLLREPPEYVRWEDAQRHASMIVELARFVPEMSPWGQRARGPVAEMPLDRLGFAASDWVRSYLLDAPHPLMCSFALATCEFIVAHAFGTTLFGRDDETAELVALVADNPASHRPFPALDGSSFKREVTSKNVGGLIAVVRVPAGARLETTQHESRPLCSTGDAFYFAIERCHLSSGVMDVDEARAHEEARPRFDIDDRFEFRGAVLGARGAPLGADVVHKFPGRFDYGDVWRANIPARWIESVVRRSTDGSPADLTDRLAVPPWAP